jgi:uncharacterized protein (TIGR02391 family)
MINFKLIAIKLGEGLKYSSSINEINRISNAIFNFDSIYHCPAGITSLRSLLIYDWVTTLSEQPIDEKSKLRLLDQFIDNLTPVDSPLRRLTRFSDVSRGPANFWSIIHPTIVVVAKSKFEDGYFADAVESALKEVNKRIKDYVKSETGRELDGASLMNHAFSLERPVIILDDLNTDTGQNIQKGYMQIFAGSMTGIRNPKAHDNINIEEARAIHFLFLASLLMYNLDEANVP